MSWTAKITGDMTLSVLDDRGFKVLGVDMLRMNTMQAGDGGEILVRTLNDLGLLAQAASAENPSCCTLADPSAGLSPRPWEIDFQEPSGESECEMPTIAQSVSARSRRVPLQRY
jgi:hypothetical protein